MEEVEEVEVMEVGGLGVCCVRGSGDADRLCLSLWPPMRSWLLWRWDCRSLAG